ncbi:2,3-dihydro-2,3-dihydroxybenzoate dehydrogenase [Parafrankia colletiae]|uniref:2,3-dihydro-2,3-dihydroxybenzoate dehydrogenase n=1 Tax=Parafrankia colletiae TaxID=573497 RepID=A0A1S1Q4E2_9ACTN|nr:2,3-dihydro-2,3-dihydroxybenzoate dehydrogenase [Parafrankia colletiae]MCK9903003.1 2,3-dihydro-2,3-dihydroxybenzoate dehydrogenase [Frankia sp. Cpl3]OHV29773.1 2,3-dihydro-2,3-dihydroxybenzoate dehydrogenase [Parafrankia colletiae]
MEDRSALVTGAAGGIGEAVVRTLAERGVRVAALDVNTARLSESVGRLRAEGLRVTGVSVDVTSSADVERAVPEAEESVGPLDYLVNAAGVLRLGEARKLTDEDWAETFRVNATGVFYMSRAVVNRMVPRGGGAVVTIASNAAGTARAEMAAYAASKAAVSAFTRCLGLEVAQFGIRCNLVAPGSTDTPMLHGMHDGDMAVRASVTGTPSAFRVGIPLGKVARPHDVADAVAFLLSDEASHITLHSLTVDGGATLGVH